MYNYMLTLKPEASAQFIERLRRFRIHQERDEILQLRDQGSFSQWIRSMSRGIQLELAQIQRLPVGRIFDQLGFQKLLFSCLLHFYGGVQVLMENRVMITLANRRSISACTGNGHRKCVGNIIKVLRSLSLISKTWFKNMSVFDF